jgi:hypothetical protein
MPSIQQLQRELRNQKIRTARMEAAIQAREAALGTNQSSVRGPQDMHMNLQLGLPEQMQPGNVGDLYQVIWPFWFTFDKVCVGPGESVSTSFTVTQEASFIWTAMTKAVFKVTENIPVNGFPVDPPPEPPPEPVPPFPTPLGVCGSLGHHLELIDSDDETDDGDADGLSIQIRDAQSKRQFVDEALDINHIGNSRFPWVLPTPQLLLPRSTIEITFMNDDPTEEPKTYVPYITFFGYRTRIEGAQNILSPVYG